jgi:hypothetical protein
MTNDLLRKRSKNQGLTKKVAAPAATIEIQMRSASASSVLMGSMFSPAIFSSASAARGFIPA